MEDINEKHASDTLVTKNDTNSNRQSFTLKEISNNVIDKVVFHYSQSIHSLAPNEQDQESAPYFDPLLGRPLIYPKIIQTLSNTTFLDVRDYGDCVSKSITYSTVYILESYVSSVRNKCFSFRRNKISQPLGSTTRTILSSYEMFISSFLSQIKKEEEKNSKNVDKDRPEKSYRAPSIITSGRMQMSNTPKAIAKCLHNSIQVLVLDIYEVTSLAEDIRKGYNSNTNGENSSDNKQHQKQNSNEVGKDLDILCNWVLPTMLRILSHSTEAINVILLQNQGNGQIRQLFKGALCSIVSVALAFCSIDVFPYKNYVDFPSTSRHLRVFDIVSKEWEEELTLNYLQESCAYSSNNLKSEKDDKLVFDRFLNETILNCNESDDCTLAMPWIDNVKNIGPRAAHNLLHCVFNLINHNMNDTTQEALTNHKDSLVLDTIIIQLGEETLLPMIRANFFGRLESHFDVVRPNNQKQSTDQLNSSIDIEYNGYKVSNMEKAEITKIKNNFQTKEMYTALPSYLKASSRVTLSQDEDCNQMPARISSALRIIASIKFPHVTYAVLSHALPILYTLIDSSRPTYQSLGGATLLHLLKECTPTTLTRPADGDAPSPSETAAQVLSMACRCCCSPVPVAILSHVRCELLKIIEPLRSRVLLREALSDFLTLVKKSSRCGPHGDTDTVSLITCVLVCGVHPVLVHLATLPDASAMEMGRQGLSTLLPLIRWDSQSIISRRVQFASINCMISLMMSAYPIMERHGGKIMSELIACIGRAHRDISIDKKIRDNRKEEELDSEANATKKLLSLAIHAASVALVLCGQRAENILKEIESGEYVSELVVSCGEVRRQAAIALKTEIER